MAMKARYTTINGQIVSQNVGGVIHDYLPDPLGHTVALIADDETITHIFDYWPYGELATLDDLATPFRYVGRDGYYSDTFGSTRMYVRARQLQGGYGRWMTVDPLWPYQSPYLYVGGSPVSITDPDGKWKYHLAPGLTPLGPIYNAIPGEPATANEFWNYVTCLEDPNFCPATVLNGNLSDGNVGTIIKGWADSTTGPDQFGFVKDPDTTKECKGNALGLTLAKRGRARFTYVIQEYWTDKVWIAQMRHTARIDPCCGPRPRTREQ